MHLNTLIVYREAMQPQEPIGSNSRNPPTPILTKEDPINGFRPIRQLEQHLALKTRPNLNQFHLPPSCSPTKPSPLGLARLRKFPITRPIDQFVNSNPFELLVISKVTKEDQEIL